MDLKKQAEEYFSSLNPIASRIYNDINQTKAAYEDLWNTMSPEEQEQIVNESIIKPEVQIKYQCCELPQNIGNQEFSMKMIIDENNCTYRDEHSAPFSFKTKSQRDLRIFASPKEVNMKHLSKTRNLKPIYIKKVENPIIDCLDEEISNMELSNSTGSLPKTGLDFLDNW